MEKIILSNTFRILQIDRRDEIIALLESHKKDIMATDYFDVVNVFTSPSDSEYLAMVSVVKSKEDMEAYQYTSRPEKQTWFRETLLDTGLLKVVMPWSMDIPIPEDVSESRTGDV